MGSERTYLKTNPWITFAFDIEKVSRRSWILLGEAVSKCEHIAGVPLMPTVARRMHSLYLAKGALATTAIEGNTLTEEEAIAHAEGKLKLPPSREYLAKELDNIIDSCNKIQQEVEGFGDALISVEKILSMNRDVLRGLPNAEEISPGEFRQHNVTVGKYRCAPWQDCKYLTHRLVEFLNDFKVSGKEAQVFAIIKATLGHLYLVWIHPFADGNGRTARLLEFYILMSAGFPAPACHLLSNHYNKTRTEYYRHLDIASKTENGDVLFLQYAVEGFVDGLKEQIEYIREQQWQVSWTNYVHELYKGKKSPAETRKRDLALVLPQNYFVPIEKIPVLTPEMAIAYSGKTRRTIKRDLAALNSKNLIEIKRGGVRAKKENILAFLPWRR
ncbi:MAG: Fic family protein [bacterium]